MLWKVKTSVCNCSTVLPERRKINTWKMTNNWLLSLWPLFERRSFCRVAKINLDGRYCIPLKRQLWKCESLGKIDADRGFVGARAPMLHRWRRHCSGTQQTALHWSSKHALTGVYLMYHIALRVWSKMWRHRAVMLCVFSHNPRRCAATLH